VQEPSLNTNTITSTDYLNDSFFTDDFLLFDGGDNTNTSNNTSNSTNNDTNNNLQSSTLPYDETHSYLLTDLDAFLSNPDNLFPFSFDTTNITATPSLVDDTFDLTSPASLMSPHQLTPFASPEPHLEILSPSIDIPSTTSPTLLNSRPTPPLDTQPPPSNPLKRKFPSISTDLGDIDSPRAKDLPPIQITETDDERDIKRKRNTAAARRYRKKKQDRMEELEGEIKELKRGKEELRQEALRWKMESEKWKSLCEILQKK